MILSKKSLLFITCSLLVVVVAHAQDIPDANQVSNKTTIPVEHNRHSPHPHLLEQYKTDDKHPDWVYFVCHKWKGKQKIGKYYRQCSSVYFYNLNYRYRHLPNYSKHYFGLHHPYYKCPRLNYGHYQYRTFDDSAAAWRWRENNCGAEKVYSRY